ncbi:Mitochondrial RNA pseudouridine synthase Rpusd4 [Geodia barretti]|uniref:Pseudouridylate synthase RPUSD4, mitochondrial n=1 Tax=Geodia barretti TaxID=519541 RepID=A0AA35QUU5_GEOBA|nr:Mitochondrial RNA pseudouridine synthase Rpusd4 [Geodia barretti]
MLPSCRVARHVRLAASHAPKAATGIREAVNRGKPLLPLDDLESLVLYKDRDVIALNKPSGLSVHTGPKVAEDLCSNLHHWQYDSPDPPNLAHRLDRDTSGVILLSRDSSAARRLAELFQQRRIKKTYWAITVNVPSKPEGRVTIPLGTKDLATQNSPRHHMHRVQCVILSPLDLQFYCIYDCM